MALTGQSRPNPSSLSPCPRCASLALSTPGINPCSLSLAPNRSLLLLDARCVSPGAARRSHCLSRCLPGLFRRCHRLPPELFRVGPAPSPAPARRLRYICEIQSPVPLRDAPSPPSHRPRQPVAQHGVSAICQSSLAAVPKWLNPFPITEKRESGTDPVPVLPLSPAPQSAAAPSSIPIPSSGSPQGCASLALLGTGQALGGTARKAQRVGSAGHSPSHSYRDQLFRACDRCDNRAEYLLLFLF